MELPSCPLAEVVVVVDQHTGPFLRQLSTVPSSDNTTSSMLLSLLSQLDNLVSLGWVDRVVLADLAGSAAVKVRCRNFCLPAGHVEDVMGILFVADNNTGVQVVPAHVIA